LLLDWLPSHPGGTARITGTDISPTMGERARGGKYRQLHIHRGLAGKYMVRYCEQSGRDWILKPEIRNLTRFQLGNLSQPQSGVPTCDIVFLRNVLIYFDLPTQRGV